jgi:lambda repressor-like predicted transcriptional regulator
MDDLRQQIRKSGVKLREIAEISGESQSTISRVLDLKLRAKIENAAKSLIITRNFEVNTWAERYSGAVSNIKPTLQ